MPEVIKWYVDGVLESVNEGTLKRPLGNLGMDSFSIDKKLCVDGQYHDLRITYDPNYKEEKNL